MNEVLTRTLREAVERLDRTILESKKTMVYAKEAYEKALFELGVAEADRMALLKVLNGEEEKNDE